MVKLVSIHKRIAAFAAIGGIGLFVSYAFAAEKNPCNVNRVDTDGNRTVLWCEGDSTAYYMHKSGFSSTCTGVPVDTMKMWLSQAQASLLSGKPLHLYYNTPGTCSVRNVTSVGLKN